MPIKTVRIFPPIGIARVGDSAEEYFLGPERRHDPAVPPTGLRDASHAIKRQGARFHLYAYDEKDKLVSELTADNATIAWTLVLANTKASADRFCRKSELPKLPKLPPVRNAKVKAKADRDSLNLRAEASLSGTKNAKFTDLRASKAAGTAKDLVCKQTLFGKPLSLTLGTIITDPDGRLIALGGHGKAESPTGKSLNEPGPDDFANHEEWYDDVADGPVNAIVTLPDGSKPTVKAAWLIVGPPKYAPELRHVVTLYDTLLQTMFDKNILQDPAAAPGFKPSFTADVFPILQRAFSLRWLYANRATEPTQMTFHRAFNKLPEVDRQRIFRMLGIPPADVAKRGQHAVGGGPMPNMFSDEFDLASGKDTNGNNNLLNGTLTPHQYKIMSLWAAGQFTDDWPGHPLPPEQTISPEALTEAALEPCIGAPLYPGIEASWKLRDEYEFSEAFRLNPDKRSAGDITKQMSLPWQSDFLACTKDNVDEEELVWWPAQRPIDVVPAGKPGQYVSWSRTKQGGEISAQNIVRLWRKLGFILRQADGTFAEIGRIL